MIQQQQPDGRMSVRGALEVLAQLRDDATIIVTNQGSARLWPRITDHPLDFHYNPSTMGGAVPFGLGLALAHPTREVIVISGDGALAMSLGSLITVAAAHPPNLTVIVLENGIYEVTGGQKIAASEARADFPLLAQAAGFGSACRFHDASTWRQQAADVLCDVGPRFIALCVERLRADDMKSSTPPLVGQLRRLRSALRD